MSFPKTLYTNEEIQKARELIQNGHKHRLTVEGSPEFKRKVKEAKNIIKAAQYDDFLQTYIKQIIETDGATQLRRTEVALWTNKYAVSDPVEAASFLIHKAHQMKDYIEGHFDYDKGELRAFQKRIEFLQKLKGSTKNQAIQTRCEELLKNWTEPTVQPDSSPSYQEN